MFTSGVTQISFFTSEVITWTKEIIYSQNLFTRKTKIDHDGSSDSDDDRRDSKNRINLYSSPCKPHLRRAEAFREQRRQTFSLSSEGKGKARPEAPDSDFSSEDNGKSYSRGRTPGLKFGPPKDIKRREEQKPKSKNPKGDQMESGDERATQAKRKGGDEGLDDRVTKKVATFKLADKGDQLTKLSSLQLLHP